MIAKLLGDNSHWWTDEIRTYDGQTEGSWSYYYGTFFDQPLGTPYVGDLVLQNNSPGDDHQGTITFRNLRILPTFSTG
jgi:hypothetical protein